MHPRRTHYYLTSFPRLPIPSTQEIVPRAIISPSISSTASRCDETGAESRRELSPSPEIDLSSPEYDYDPHGIMFSTSKGVLNTPANYVPRENYTHNQFTSPPLEKDEKEFTQTARGVHRHKLGEVPYNGAPSEMEGLKKIPDEDSLFDKPLMFSHSAMLFGSSPVIKSSVARKSMEESIDLGSASLTDLDMRSPENIELEELDGMFDDLKDT